jgi:hypothetical protein
MYCIIFLCHGPSQLNFYISTRWAFFWIPLWSVVLFCLFVISESTTTFIQQKAEQQGTSQAQTKNWKWQNKSRASRFYMWVSKQCCETPSTYLLMLLFLWLDNQACAFLSVWLMPTMSRIIQPFGGTIHERLMIVSAASMYAQVSSLCVFGSIKRCVEYIECYHVST